MDKLSKKLIEYGFKNQGHCVTFYKNGIYFIYMEGEFKITEENEQLGVKLKTANLPNIKRAIKGIVGFTLIRS